MTIDAQEREHYGIRKNGNENERLNQETVTESDGRQVAKTRMTKKAMKVTKAIYKTSRGDEDMCQQEKE